MYQSLLYAVKNRMLQEMEYAFINHPAFTEKVKVYHKFPYQERVQYGVVLRNSSASQIRMSADNYLAEHIAMTRLVKETNYPGLSIEWVRENSHALTEFVTEDVSSQITPNQRMCIVSYPILAGPGNLDLATNVGQVTVTFDGIPQVPEFINAEKRLVLLRRAPAAGVKTLVTYHRRKIALPGIYVFDFIEDRTFMIYPIYTIDGEVVIGRTTGTEITISLAHDRIQLRSDFLKLRYPHAEVPIKLVRGVDYSIDYDTGVITFLQPLSSGYMLIADYRYSNATDLNGPFTFTDYQENHEVIPGVVVAIGRRAKKGDHQAVVVTQKRESQARIYGGHWAMSLDIAVIAKDPVQMNEMTDQLINWLWATRKNQLEFEGITLNSVEPTGETEEAFIENTGDVYYTSGVTVNVQTEWQAFKPYLYEIKDVITDIRQWPGTKTYDIGENGALTFVSDDRAVMEYPIVGYERLG